MVDIRAEYSRAAERPAEHFPVVDAVVGSSPVAVDPNGLRGVGWAGNVEPQPSPPNRERREALLNMTAFGKATVR